MKCLVPVFLAGAVLAIHADDWPQFRGVNRDAVWSETGILQSFPPEGLKLAWRAQVGGGMASPVISEGRLYMTGAELQQPKARECVQSTRMRALPG